MIEITFNKKLDLIFGLIYSVYRDTNHVSDYPNWVKSTYPIFDNAFYDLYKKGITEEFKDYILNGGLDTYNRTVDIGLSLNDDYEITTNEKITEICARNKIFNPTLLSKYLKNFCNKIDYDKFYLSFNNIQQNLIKEFRKALNTYVVFYPKIIENFFGYSKGTMKIIILNFSSGSYGMETENEIIYVSGIAVNNEIKFSTRIICVLFHEFSHPYVNPLGKKYFGNLELEEVVKSSQENGLERCYNGLVTLINEYVVRAIQVVLSSRYLEDSYNTRHIEWLKKIGYPYIEDLINLFEKKENYMTFEEFYKFEIVKFFCELNENLSNRKLL